MKRYVYKSNKLTLQEFLCEQLKKLEDGKEELRTDLETHKEKLVTDLETHKEQLVTDLETHKEQLVTDLDIYKEQLVTDFENHKEEVLNITNDFIDTTNKDLYENSKIDFYGNEHKTLDSRLNADFDNVHQRINESELLPYEGSSIKADNTYYGLQKDTVVKGRTLQNIVKSYNSSEFKLAYQASVSEGVFTLPEGKDINNMYVRALASNHLYKPNTIYTVFVDILENTTGKKLGMSNLHSMIHINYERDFQNLTGVSCIKIKTSTDGLTPQGVEPTLGIYFGIWEANNTSGEFSKYIKFKYWIIEGDHTQTPLEELPYIEGIESVGESELTDEGYKVSGKATGKNLVKAIVKDMNHSSNVYVECEGGRTLRSSIIKLPKGVYSLSFEKFNTSEIKDGSICIWDNTNSTSYKRRSAIKQSFEILEDEVGITWYGSFSTKERKDEVVGSFIQIEEGAQATPYEPYKETTYSYILNEPLRSLPNGVCDTIDLATGVLTRRVGKVVLDGSENWSAWDNIQTIQDTHVAFTLGHDFMGTNYMASNEKNLLCNNFMVSDNASTINNSKPNRLCALNTHVLFSLQFKIEKTSLVSADCNGFKQWLQANPTTVIYELAEPTTEQLTPEQLKSFDTTTHIISDNKLMPVVKTKIHSNVQAIISTLRLENNELRNNVETLSIENENLKETVNNQNNLIDTSLCATDELYCMIENLLPEVIE